MPWEIYQSFSLSSDVSFFLDSHSYSPPDQNYSYLGFNPYLEVILQQGEIQVRGGKHFDYPASDLFPLLRKIFKDESYQAGQKMPFFTGGAVGYWGYELASFF